MRGNEMKKHYESDSIECNGVSIHYYRLKKDKPPLLLLHGFTDNGLCWTRCANQFEQDFDVIMPDARGHGLSEKPEKEYSASLDAADISQLIQALKLAPVIVIGHSMGANTAATLAATYPHLIRAIILEDPPWRDRNDPALIRTDEQAAEIRESWYRQLQAQVAKDPTEIDALGRKQNPLWHEEDFPSWVESKLQVSPNVVNMITANNQDWAKVIGKIQCPMLLIIGNVNKGGIVSKDKAQDLSHLNKSMQVTCIKDAGHNIHRENFTEFIRRVRTFLFKNKL